MVLRDCSCLSRHLYRGRHSCGNKRKNPPRGLVVPPSIQRRTLRRPTTRVRNARTQAVQRFVIPRRRILLRDQKVRIDMVIVEQRFIAVKAKGKFFCSFTLAKIGVVAKRYEGSTSRGVCIPSSLVRPFDCAKLPMDCFEQLNETSFGVGLF